MLIFMDTQKKIQPKGLKKHVSTTGIKGIYVKFRGRYQPWDFIELITRYPNKQTNSECKIPEKIGPFNCPPPKKKGKVNI